MALELSPLAKVLAAESNIESNIILEIAGIPTIFGADPVTIEVTIGSFIIGDGTLIGGTSVDEDSKDWIQYKGTTNNISQKVNLDKGGSTSITSFKVNLIDKDDALTEMFSPGAIIDDTLGAEATVYWAAIGGSHPRDSVKLFIGIIDRMRFGAGYVEVNVADPAQKLRQTMLPVIDMVLVGDIDNSVTTITVDDTTGLLSDQDLLTTYVRIEDEIIKVGAISGNDLTGCTRGELNTPANPHEDESEASSFYRLQGRPVETALKIMLSGADDQERNIERLVSISASETINNAIYFEDYNIEEELGLVPGDLITMTGATNPSNNVTDRAIASFGIAENGSYIILSGAALVPEIDAAISFSAKSQYNTLNFGAEMKPYQVDVAQFENMNLLFSSQFPDYDFYIDQEEEVRSFIDEQVLFPAGLFSIPRKARVSVNLSAPPITDADTRTLNSDNVKKATNVVIERTINDLFYNAIIYKFDRDSIEDKFLKSRINISETSNNRIKTGSRPLIIDAYGLRDNDVTQNLIQVQSRRFLDRYQYGSEKVVVETNFATGFPIELSDTVIFEGASLKVSDTINGTRDFAPRIMEVTNKSLNLKDGNIKLTLLDTNYSAVARYGSISGSSIIGTGSTATKLKLVKSFGTGEFALETDKWQDYIGEKIHVRSEDYTTILGEAFIQSIPANEANTIVIDTALSSAPTGGFILEVPPYDDSSERAMRLYKSAHAFFNPQALVVSATSTTVEVSDPSIFFEGCSILVHTPTYTSSLETIVIDITGTTLTLEDDLGFTPVVNDEIDLIGFSGDNGLPYRIF